MSENITNTNNQVMFKSLQPLYDRVVVKPIDNENTAGMLKMPDTMKEKPTIAIVFAVGVGSTTEDGKYIPLITKVGDTVLIPKYGGTEIDFNGEKYQLMKEQDVQAILLK